MDLSFGKGDQAVGGILIRAITSVGAANGKHLPVDEFVEGPCNTVSRILEHNSPAGNIIKEVKDFVILDNFTTDSFKVGSRLYLSRISEEDKANFKLPWAASRTPLFRGPRVGLTLKRYDEFKPRFWLRDYRFVAYPERHRKMQFFVMLGMMGASHRLALADVVRTCKTKVATVEELKQEMDKGHKSDKKIEDFKDTSGEMKTKDFAFAFGVHQKQHAK